MRTIAVMISLTLLSALTHADEITIFDVRKSLPMSNDEKPFKDFYLNKGSESGLREGMVITAKRRIPLYDAYQNRSVGDLAVDVAKIQVIHVQKGLAVARLYEDITREGRPLLEDPFILVGDHLDLATATLPSRGKKSAQLEKSAEKPQAPAEVSQLAVPDTGQNAVDFASKAPDNTPQGSSAVPSLQ